MIVNVLLEAGPPNWCASSADAGLVGVVVATAPTRPAVIREFKSALRAHLDYLRDTREDVPVIDGLEIRELVAA